MTAGTAWIDIWGEGSRVRFEIYDPENPRNRNPMGGHAHSAREALDWFARYFLTRKFEP